MVRINVQLSGNDHAIRGFQQFRHRSENMRPVLEELADDFLEAERRLFDTEGASSGHPWKALAASTVRQKLAAGQDPRILHSSLAMRNSLTQRGARGSIRTIRNDELVVGTRITDTFVNTRTSGTKPTGFPYPEAHQEGGRKLPRRPIIAVTRGERRSMVDKVREYLMGERDRTVVRGR